MKHTLIISYFSEAEVARYVQLAAVLGGWRRPEGLEVECLICTVCTGIAEDPRLTAAFRALMPTRTYRCTTEVVGYPGRPTAMFWEILDHVAETDDGGRGFALWMEADMVPTRPSWLEDLDRAWRQNPGVLVLGRTQPRSYVAASRSLIPPHVNGGACYAKSYAREIPKRFQVGTFDVAPWTYLAQTGRYSHTELFRYATSAGLREELASSAAVLHGYRQDKDAFLARWRRMVEGHDARDGGPAPAPEACCDLRRRHLGLTYCPIHDERTPAVQLANWVSVVGARAYFGLRRRVRQARGWA